MTTDDRVTYELWVIFIFKNLNTLNLLTCCTLWSAILQWYQFVWLCSVNKADGVRSKGIQQWIEAKELYETQYSDAIAAVKVNCFQSRIVL